MKNNAVNATAGGGALSRSDLDFYETPAEVTREFLRTSKWTPKTGLIWEPAAGNKAIAKVLDEELNTIVYCSDIVERDVPLDLVGDFLDVSHDDGTAMCDIVTNPPFSLAQQFVEQALEIAEGDVVMLLRLAFLETQARRKLFDRQLLREVWVSSKRIHFSSPALDKREQETGKKSNSGMAMAWFIFNKRYVGDPVIKWI